MCIVHQLNAKSGCFVCRLMFRPAQPQGSVLVTSTVTFSVERNVIQRKNRRKRRIAGWILDDNMEEEDCGRPLSAWWHCVVGVVYAEWIKIHHSAITICVRFSLSLVLCGLKQFLSLRLLLFLLRPSLSLWVSESVFHPTVRPLGLHHLFCHRVEIQSPALRSNSLEERGKYHLNRPSAFSPTLRLRGGCGRLDEV